VVEEPEEHNVAAVAVDGSDCAPVVADRCSDPVIAKSVDGILGAGWCDASGPRLWDG